MNERQPAMMRYSVVIALALLCQTCHLCVGVEPENPEDVITTTPQEEIIITTQKDITTSQKVVSISPCNSKQHARTTVVDPLLENDRVPTCADQLVVCSCPEPTPDGCRRFLSDAYIDSKNSDFKNIRVPVADLRVAVHNVTCQKKDHRFMTYGEGKFYWREYGDVVLVDAGDMTDLRVNDYCADLRRDLTWNMKICVAPPSVPKCCPSGQALKDGMCQDATTLAILAPPMYINLEEKSIHFPVIKNHYNPLNCTSDPLLSIPLAPKQSYLLSVPTGLIHVWNPADSHVENHFTYSPNICIDGYVNSNGSETYSVNFCYSHPHQQRKNCEGHICVRKCCPDGEEMSRLLKRCVPSNFKKFKPVFTNPPNDYKIVHGRPKCDFETELDEPSIDSEGHYHFEDNILSESKYCVDKFNDGRGNIKDMAIVCVNNEMRLWLRIRKTAFPIFQFISFLFLLLTMGCYCVVPELVNGGGWYQLFHVFSLMVAYATMFAQNMFNKNWETNTCFIMGILLQFSFLSTFFWLNVLCFEVWRKIRSLDNKFRPASIIPIWVYVIYAFGTPVAIVIITVCMHFFAPEGVPGVVKPDIARNKCFFEDRSRLFLYFYGPVAFLFALNIIFITHTSWTYRMIEKNVSVLKKATSPSVSTEQIHRKRDYISEALTDTLNTLQGFFLFVIFIANRSKRKRLKKKFPLVFKFWDQIGKVLRHWCCWWYPGAKESCLAPLGNLTSQFGRTLSSSFIVSNVSTPSTFLRFSKYSFSMDLPDDGSITTLSHSSTVVNSASLHDNTDTQC
ncbi:probable G-protein coupled receptor Mth-like 1 isoform X2 [Portunus trituberculatus]|uniref:probable G-protein coupled receptor Mth-like 1 isoform X2 n=1 Tax=Portunus trituberculatus TaxID=210409 RepID=UPI001E1CD3E0|nr:probable G-protein coupled receptor Mth-like 1 isoform X2 [Portunus trituberculatus]